MKLFLYSHDINHISYWEKALCGSSYEVVLEEEMLNALKDCFVILAYEGVAKFHALLHALGLNGNRTLVLDPVPTVPKAKSVLRNGARGYGNALMSSLYMNTAIESIKSENIWLTPTLTKELIQSIEPIKELGKQLEILSTLSSKEADIALLLKDGLGNQEIAQKQNISINTVKTHIKNIYAKLGVNDKFAFAMLFR